MLFFFMCLSSNGCVFYVFFGRFWPHFCWVFPVFNGCLINLSGRFWQVKGCSTTCSWYLFCFPASLSVVGMVFSMWFSNGKG